MNRIFNIDLPKLVLLLTPTFLRQARFKAWLVSFVYPLTSVQSTFQRLRGEDIYKLECTPQVCSLEAMLNDKFDIVERRIRIGESLRADPFFIFAENENTPKFIDNEKDIIYLNAYNEGAGSGGEFVVYLPFEVWDREKTEEKLGKYRFYQMEALLDFYKLAGKKYKIVLNG
ncbi:hypothetical protein MWN41_07055 [Ornithobacterium rhinotracheale]|uniref:hypothetical protein n=1 Tax=Ornithobacterium rhinotracheale TaxID=28251 RepID=UPI001FF2C165|nr:hypothetical protein [Ornithobacterium rhinotracheale]MCK0202776.1 hypothetical protein [Ornithobacterium rhinotracheale]